MDTKTKAKAEMRDFGKTPFPWSRFAFGLLFMLAGGGFAALAATAGPGLQGSSLWILMAASAVGAYMAMNIGANDVANNLGPAVGSGVITLGWAIFIAAVFEALGAVVAGGEVVDTVKGGIINPANVDSTEHFVWLMLAALLAGAVWLNIATSLGAPVSTTHSIIGAVMGAGIAAGGWAMVNWGTILAIVGSWVLSPLLGGIIAMGFLYVIKRTITYQADMTLAASRVVPILLALMGWAFVTFMFTKGIGQLPRPTFFGAALWGFGAAVLIYLVPGRVVARKALCSKNGKMGVNELFTWPLICAAALLSFAHGANDVANAVGPLAAIYEALREGVIASKAPTPLWIMILGALGLSVGLALFGARLIRIVGKEITELDHMRAFSIAMAATLTVILAAQLGMPISTTHVTIGAVIGVGFLRELLKANYAKMEAVVRAGHSGRDLEEIETYLREFEAASVKEKQRMYAEMKLRAAEIERINPSARKERKAFKKVTQQELVKRSVLMRILAAWIITVPATAIIAAGLFAFIVAFAR
jgi:PiT family inorganic phosphate transporter